MNDTERYAHGVGPEPTQGTPIQVEVTCCQEHQAKATAIRQAMVETGQPLKDLASLLVVHVDNSSTDGRAVERAQAEMRRLNDAGWAVAPVPADDQEHPYGEPCPVCTTGPFWDTEALTREFEVLGFAAPYVVARRRSDGVKGSLEFTHRPRVYFNWTEAT